MPKPKKEAAPAAKPERKPDPKPEASIAPRPIYRACYVVDLGTDHYHAGDTIENLDPGEARRLLALGAIALIE